MKKWLSNWDQSELLCLFRYQKSVQELPQLFDQASPIGNMFLSCEHVVNAVPSKQYLGNVTVTH
jgi:hypothetical protein